MVDRRMQKHSNNFQITKLGVMCLTHFDYIWTYKYIKLEYPGGWKQYISSVAKALILEALVWAFEKKDCCPHRAAEP